MELITGNQNTDLIGLFWYANGPRGRLYVYDRQCLHVIFFYVSRFSARAKRTRATFYNVGDAKSAPELNI